MLIPPSWVPRSVRDVSARAPAEHILRRQLLTDPRMQPVWRTLETRGRKLEHKLACERKLRNLRMFEEEDPLAFLPQDLRMETWGALMLATEKALADGDDKVTYETREVSFADQLCAAFYLATVLEFAVPKKAVTVFGIKKEAQRWRTGADLCREALSSPDWGALTDPTLANALAAAAVFFERRANFIEIQRRDSPYVVERNSRNRAPGGSSEKLGDDAIRGQVRALAKVTQTIFGSYLYRTVATAASVASGLSVSQKDVENWCDGLPRVSH
jgi:hypothetical protein